jgi:long-chain acyl-CoA synthetase
VREFSLPAMVTLADDEGLANTLYNKTESQPDAVVFSRRTPQGWQDVSYREFAALVRGLARGLVASGIEPGQRVLVLGRTSYEWSAVDFALLSVGAVTVPVYPTASVEQVRHIVRDCAPSASFAETAENQSTLTAAAGDSLAGRRWLLGESFDALIERGRDVADSVVDQRRREVTADSTATIVYTSGTTGQPKGCVLTHRNIFAAAANVVEVLDVVFRRTPEDPASTLLFLPLAHVYGRVTQFGCVWAGVRTGLVAAAADLVGELAAFRPTFLVGVPYVLEKLRKAARQLAGDGPAGVRYEAAAATAIEYGKATRHGHPISEELRAAHAGFSEIYGGLRATLGGRLHQVIAGGASLDPSTADFFTGLGVEILGAYGLTEASSAVSMSAPGANRANAVGRPVPGTAVAIADDGEILVRGTQVFPGYWSEAGPRDTRPSLAPSGRPGAGAPQDTEATGSAVQGGTDWWATGDLGQLDEDGYLHITGRRKEIIITSGGKNVAPAPIEDRVRLHPLVSNCMLVGEGRPYVAALITLDLVAFPGWARNNGIDPAGDSWPEDARLRKEIQSAVDAANELVSQAESIRRFRILPADFSIERGHVTASLRLRRKVIENEFDADITALYSMNR